jgi:hypothetical protein
MKSRDKHINATVFAAIAIIGCCLSSMLSCHKARSHQKRFLEEAVKTWEDEGGAVPVAREEDDEELPVSRV